MKLMHKLALAIPAIALGGQALAQITLYSRDGLRGEAITLDRRAGNFERHDFDDRASSAVVEGGRWEVCEEPRFQGRCMVLRPGTYHSLRDMGMNNAISSARPTDGRYGGSRRDEPVQAPRRVAPAYAPADVVYEAPVTSVRTVMGPPEQRCWIEREQVAQPQQQPSVGGAIIGGVLGRQVGKGSGRDAATVGGAVAGAAVGAHLGGTTGTVVTERDVQRCSTAQSGQAAYWDVTYVHGGMQHRVQMTTPPGATIRVNSQGAPML